MPVLQPRRSAIKQFYLPSTLYKKDENGQVVKDEDGKPVPNPIEDQAWVKVDLGSLKTGDIMVLSDEENITERVAKLFLPRITEWNYTEVDGSATEITFENLCRLDVDDFYYLTSREVTSSSTDLTDIEKKS